jgi:1,3-beta-glucanosyltransferase GAS1
MKFSSVLVGAALLAGTALADVDPIVIDNSKFFYKTNGSEFFIRGVAYQQDYTGSGSSSDSSQNSTGSYIDPLADSASCKRDIPYMIALRTNTIRVYAVDPTQNHDECMQMLADAGIYVISDLSSPSQSIIRDDPKWDVTLYQRYTAVVDAFAKYNNVIGFFAGNEVSNNLTNTNASAFVKAAVRDMKAYIKAKNYRPMGIGYATNDDSSIRVNMANYFNCGPSDSSIDFWGYNVYSWCGDSSYQQSGYKDRTEEFANYSVPVFFAEYGCNTVQPRKFTEVAALFGDVMTQVWSGGIVYMYFEEANNYGLVSVTGNTVSKLPDYSYLSSEMGSVTATGVSQSAYHPSNTVAQACPTVDSNWAANEKLPPSPNEQLCSCMVSSLTCVVKGSVSGNQLSQLFGQVCGYGTNICSGITPNATSGIYGAYSMCDGDDQLSFAMDQYYQGQVQQGNGASACDFGGAASTQSSSSPSGTCSVLLQQAGTQGTGSVAANPTATGLSSSGSGSGSSSSSAAARPMAAPSSVHFGMWQVGAYIFTAAVAGVGMIIL